MVAKKFQYQARQSRDAATFDGTYQTLGSPISSPGALIKLVNNTDQLVDISTDGVTDHDVMPEGSYYLYGEDDKSFKTGTQFYVNGPVGTGLIYLVVLEVS